MKASKLLLVLLALALAGSPLFAGGAKAGTPGADAGPTPISVFFSSNGRVWAPEERLNMQELMKRTNTVLDVTMAAGGVDQLNLLFASNDLPDIISWSGIWFSQYFNTGKILPLDDLIKNYGSNIQNYTSQDAWKYMTVQGKIYGMPFENTIIKHYTGVRSDWLKNAGVDLSKNKDYGDFGGKYVTLDEYKDLLIKFTRNDPDKNGKNDTYGLGATGKAGVSTWVNICGAFGGIPGHYYIADGKALPWVVTDQYRQALQYINGLWKEGVVDPEIYLFNADQARQKMFNSVSGSVTGVWWSAFHDLLYSGIWKLTPDADFVPLFITSNDGKTLGAPDNGLISSSNCITTESRNPEKVMEFLNYVHTDEGYYLIRKGIEGLDYTWINGFPIFTEMGNDKQNNGGLDTIYPLTNRIELMNLSYHEPPIDKPDVVVKRWGLIQTDNSQPHYTSVFYGLPSPRASDEFGVDVNNWIEQSSMAFITGETPLNDANWNNYINTWKRMGGVKILQGYIDAYNSLNGTKITAGITE